MHSGGRGERVSALGRWQLMRAPHRGQKARCWRGAGFALRRLSEFYDLEIGNGKLLIRVVIYQNLVD